MVKRINRTVILIIVFISILMIGNQVVIYQYDISTNKLVLEYNEMHSLQNFRFSLIQFQNSYLKSISNTNISYPLDSLLNNLKLAKIELEKSVTKRHLDEDWSMVLTHYKTLTSINTLNIANSNYTQINTSIIKIVSILNEMIFETKDEILEAKERNMTLQKHSTLTLLSAGVILVIIVAMLSIFAAKSLTTPIQEFLKTFKKLGSGDMNVRVNINSKDEFEELAIEFNKLFDQLNKTTVTLEYVRNIIDSIYGALFVTDNKGNIISINKTVIDLLGYKENEIVNTNILNLFREMNTANDNDDKYPNHDGDNLIELLKNSESIRCRNNEKLPVLTTCTSFTSNEKTNLIVVVHDISEKIEYQEQIENAKRKTMAAINEAQEAERTRIATEIHDSLGQKLSAISFSLHNILDQHNDKDKISDIQKLVDETISETRTISHSIMPGVLKDFGLVAALKDLIDSTNKIQNIKFSFNHYSFDERISPNTEKVLYRICQEALNNILKHSKASNAIFQLFKSKDLITLTIEDDGVGFNPKTIDHQLDEGIGLISINERVTNYNGGLIINSTPKNGTEIIVEIPYKS